MQKGLLPGSFDPPSLGHLDIISRAAKICDYLYIGIARNRNKQGSSTLFTHEERLSLLNKVISKDFPTVEVVIFDSLVVDFAKDKNVNFIVRGLRAFSDFEYEFRMALANRKMSGIETLFLMADAKLAHVSSSLIKDIGSRGKHLKDFVPPQIEEDVFKKFQEVAQKQNC